MKKVSATYVFLTVALGVTLQSLRVFGRNDEHPCDFRNSSDDWQGCHSKDGDTYLRCFGGLHGKWTSGSKTVRQLVLCAWPEDVLEAGRLLRKYPELRDFTIANSNLTRLSTTFPAGARELEKISVIGTRVRELPENAFFDMPGLKILDLRNNSLTELNAEIFNASSLESVYLTGNPWNCTHDAAWILDTENGSVARRVVDRDKLVCGAPYEGRPLVPVIEIIRTLKEECRRTVCTCDLMYVTGRASSQNSRLKDMVAFITVNCSHRELTEMPLFLPARTTTLRLDGNKITDLTPLATNPVYEGTIDVYLDDNLVESVAPLEGSSWLDRFRILSLRGNKLTDVPTYALENVLLQNGNAVGIYLGKNPWRCDCLFTPGFQDLLIRYTNLVKDINDIRCCPVEGDDNSNKLIRDLTRTAICIPPEESWLQPLDVLNAVLAALIFLILGKLLYDYWSFKKTGKLPWIVAKIP